MACPAIIEGWRVVSWSEGSRNRYPTQLSATQAAIRETVGRVTAAGLTKEVTFERVSRKINEVLCHC
jgi:hypothetical protein